MSFFISEAHAQTPSVPAPITSIGAAVPGAAGAPIPAPTIEQTLMQFLPLFLIFGVFYFLLIRPQQKRFEQHKAMVEGVRRGDKVVTAGGILGVVTKVEDGDEVTVEIADNVKVRIVKSTISQVNAKIEPGNDNAADKKSA
jgi:preprotein translocase subunit YajC